MGPAINRTSRPLGSGDLAPIFRAAFPDERFIVVSNREPYEHQWGGKADQIEVRRPAGGLTSALDPVLQSVGGVWIAWGSGDADAAVVGERDRIRVPPEAPSYTLRRLWLDPRDVSHYYLGYANQFLWPLCHLRPTLTRPRARYWQRYARVNRRFALAVLEEAEGVRAAVWFQDYHLALAPAFVRAERPDLSLAHFWHIPWPPLDLYRITPQARELLEGLLANDLLGFQLRLFSENFLHCVEEIVGAEVDWEAGTARYNGHTCHVRALPISIDVEAYARAATRRETETRLARLPARYKRGGAQMGIGVDRVDYSKGLPEKLKALELFWERHPEFRERFTFVQVAVPSRTDIGAYDELAHEVERMAWKINDRYGTGDWRPIHLIKEALPMERLVVLYRAADVCLVTSLIDGMNLVSKEYVASQPGGDGVLLLSRFAGAAEELDGCIEVNPYDPESLADRIYEALALPIEDRRARMRRMRASLRTIYDWMAENFRAWGAVSRERRQGARGR